MLAAGIALVTARVRIGPGGAIGALVGYIAIRGTLALLIGPVFGEITPHFPPYVVEALVVEGVALLYCVPVAAARPPPSGRSPSAPRRSRHRHDRPRRRMGLSHVWVVNPWPASLFPEGAITGLIAAVAGGVIGGFIGRCLTPASSDASGCRAPLSRRRRSPRSA